MSLFTLLADILFVGHSLVGPDLPPLVEAALRAQGNVVRIESQVINGASLAFNWDHGAEAEGVDARAELALGQTIALIVTEAQPLAAHLQWSDTAGRVAAYAALATEQRPDVTVYLYETWPSLDSAPGRVVENDPDAGIPWRERLTRDLALWQGVVADASAKGTPVVLIPAGQAMGLLSDEIDAGRVPGLTSIRDMFTDDIHPNGRGRYFLAILHAAAISGQSPEGLPAKLTRSWQSRDAMIPDDLAPVLQRLAWAALQANLPAPVAAPVVAPVSAPVAAPVSPPVAAPPEAAPPIAAPALPDTRTFPPVTNPNLSVGLSGINDWSVQHPFLNLMKTARPWVGHLPGQWGGFENPALREGGYLDPRGWPRAIPPQVTGLSTLILTDLPDGTGGVAGRYLLTHAGNGTLTIEGRAEVVQAEPGRILFDYTPGEGAVLLTLAATDPADPLRDIVVVREDRAKALAAGDIFNPDWLNRLRGVQGVRFMDWMATNNSTLATSADRPRPDDATWARNGVPMEIMIALANELMADPWFTMPHLADDALVRELATLARDGLDPMLVAQVEFSNEVWNWQFSQATWAEDQARARWGQDQAWVQFYALRAAEVADIWAATYGGDTNRLIRIVATQTGWIGLEDQILNAPLVLAEGRNPVDSFDAYAVTGYVSALLGHETKADAVRQWLTEGTDAATAKAIQELRDGSVTGDPTDSLSLVMAEILPHHAAVAADHGLRLMMYEGGSHIVGIGPVTEDQALTDFFTQLNYTPEMGEVYRDLMTGWRLLTDAPFNAFVDVAPPGKWGSWGALRHLTDDNPRWTALAAGCPAC